MPFNIGGNILTNTQVNVYNGSSIVRNGLLMYLDAGIANSYPGSGTTWTDLSGNSLNGTLTNGPTYSTAVGGNIFFDGTDDYIDIGTNVYNMGIRRHATFTGWMTSLSAGGGAYLFSDWNGLGMTLRFNNTTSTDFYVYGNNRRVTVSYTFTPGTWYHITGVMDGDNMYTYINGLLGGSQTLGEDIGSSPSTLKIGPRGDGAGMSNQRVGNALIYNRALSAAEVLQNYNANRRRFGI